VSNSVVRAFRLIRDRTTDRNQADVTYNNLALCVEKIVEMD
jgi:hypothetical protein